MWRNWSCSLIRAKELIEREKRVITFSIVLLLLILLLPLVHFLNQLLLISNHTHLLLFASWVISFGVKLSWFRWKFQSEICLILLRIVFLFLSGLTFYFFSCRGIDAFLLLGFLRRELIASFLLLFNFLLFTLLSLRV